MVVIFVIFAIQSSQALKVMGFTSELRFLAGPVYRGEAELEVRTRGENPELEHGKKNR